MAQQNNNSIFQRVYDAVNNNKRRTPPMDAQGQPPGIATPSQGMFGNLEDFQQQYLDWQVNKISHDLYTRTIYYDTDRINSYHDYRAMDQSPEVSAALDIMRDECLAGDTIIPILDGTKKTIEELYNEKRKDFQVYSYNPSLKRFESGLCERVVFKGEQDVFKITFEDGSSIEATSEHQWLMLNEDKYKTTSELKNGDSIQPFYTKISDSNDRIDGYEMILENGDWEYTHRIVKKQHFPLEKGVTHHVDFDKRNNCPNNLKVMSWGAHQELHASLNSYRWKNNKEFRDKMRKVFSETNSADGKYWSDPEWRANRQEQMSKNRKAKYSSWTKEQLLENFSRPGEENGMYGKGDLLSGNKNGRWKDNWERNFSESTLIDAYKKTSSINEAASYLGTGVYAIRNSSAYKRLNLQRWEDIGFIEQEITEQNLTYACVNKLGEVILENSLSLICEENKWSSRIVRKFLKKNNLGRWTDFVAKFKSKQAILDQIKSYAIQDSSCKMNLSAICRKYNYSYKTIEGILARSEHGSWGKFRKAFNHRIESIEFVGKKKTYDLVNVGEHHNFAVLTTNGTGVISHNCLTRNERGNILEIYSSNDRIKNKLDDLFYNRMNIDYNLSLWIRDLIKYGDYFVHLHVHKDEGVYDFMTLPQEEIHREEGFDGTASSVRFRWETTQDYFESWQIAHFRLIEDTRKLPYGRSILDPARKLWKQLQLAEDSMLVYRITRAPERRIFYIEVGNLEDADVKQYMQRIQRQVKKQPVVNQNNGNMSYRYDPMNISEDYFIPVRGDKSTKIDTLPGACLALDTKIELLDGRSLELNEIIKERDEGKQLWTYSINPETGEIVPGKITWAGVTRKDAQVMKLTFDNGESVTVTPDHKFPTRFKGLQEAQNLEVGDSMWSFEKRFEKIKGGGKKRKRNTYEQVWNHEANSWEYTHRMVHGYMKDRGLNEEFEYKPELYGEDKNTIHHSDFNRYNNSPENLVHMNGKDHFYYHQDNMGRLIEFFGEETVESWKNDRKAGLKEYWNNISEEELKKKRITAIANLEKATERIQELLRDDAFKSEFEKKRITGYRKARKTAKSRRKSSIATSKQWANGSLREVIKEKQGVNYSDILLQFVVSRFQDGVSAADILIDINADDSKFMSEFNTINQGNKQLKKMSSFTHNNLVKMMKHFGYKNWRDFTKKAELFNHKITKIEWLNGTQDTGTITVDGNHELHDYHNFALSSGVFTQNSNLGDIQDIEYLENKLFAALKVPKTYLNYAENLPGGPTLSQADLRFARTINRIQEQVLMELRRIAKIHLAFLGHEDEINDFDLKLTNPSTQQELLKLETMKSRLEVFQMFVSQDIYSPASYTWGMKYILGFSEKDIKKMLRQKKVERKLFTEIEFAPQTYKKIGLFKDLDDKFEIPGAAEALQAAENEDMFDAGGDGGGFGGGGGGDSLAGDPTGDLNLGGDGDAGGGDFGGAPAGGAPGGGDTGEPISETRRKRIWEGHNNRVDDAIDDLLKELEETDEEVFTEEEDKKDTNALFNSNEELISQTDKMIREIKGKVEDSEKDIENYVVPKGVIKERIQGNPLVSSSNDLAEKARNIMAEIDERISESEDSDVEIIEDEYGEDQE